MCDMVSYLCMLIQYIKLSEAIVHMLYCTCIASFNSSFLLLVVRGVPSLILAQNTGFGSFKLPTCDWLQKGRSHSHIESSLVWWLCEMLHELCTNALLTAYL